MMRWFWSMIWNTAEWTGTDLGRFAFYVFGKMIGKKGKRIDASNLYFNLALALFAVAALFVIAAVMR